jgi:hypothetical protein
MTLYYQDVIMPFETRFGSQIKKIKIIAKLIYYGDRLDMAKMQIQQIPQN